MSRCLFKDCFNRPPPFSGLTFFNIPKDGRRDLWLQRSGNEEAQNLPPNARRLVCEMHFEEKHLRRQFLRTTLARDAVPMSYLHKKKVLAPKKKPKPREDVDEEAEAVTDEMEMNVQEVPDNRMMEEPSETAEYEMVIEEECLLSNDSLLCLSENDGTIEVVTEENLEVDRIPASSRQVVEEIEISFCSNGEAEEFQKKTETKSASTQTEEPSIEDKDEKANSLPQKADQATNTDPVVEKTFKEEEPQPPPTNPISTKVMTEDDYFALSLVGPLQKLTPEQRAMAKVKILTYLVQLQCGVDANL